MANGNFWTKNVPRVEYDHKARAARLHLEQTERLLVRQDTAVAFGYFRLLRLFGAKSAGGARKHGQGTEASIDCRTTRGIRGAWLLPLTQRVPA